MPYRTGWLFAALLLAAPIPAQAGLPECKDASVAEAARFQFDDARESSDPPSPRRSRALAGMHETGRAPNSNPLAPPGTETRFCEAVLKLDDSTTLPLFIAIAGKDGDGKAGFDGLEACWQDARFPRLSSCKTEMAPGRQ